MIHVQKPTLSVMTQTTFYSKDLTPQEWEQFDELAKTGISVEKAVETFFTKPYGSIENVKYVGNNVQVFNIPVNVPPSILDLLKTGELKFKNFWLWLSMNPSENARTHIDEWLKENNVVVDDSGYLIMFRNVLTCEHANWYPELNDKLEKLRKNKKGTNLPLYKKDGKISLTEGEYLGLELKNLDQIYTDAHTKNEIYVLGVETRMKRSDADESWAECSRGYHMAGDNYNYGGFGDKTIACLVNPKDIVACVEGSSKMRTCAFIPIKVIDNPEDRANIDPALIQDALEVAESNIADSMKSHEWGEDNQTWAVDLSFSELVSYKEYIEKN